MTSIAAIKYNDYVYDDDDDGGGGGGKMQEKNVRLRHRQKGMAKMMGETEENGIPSYCTLLQFPF